MSGYPAGGHQDYDDGYGQQRGQQGNPQGSNANDGYYQDNNDQYYYDNQGYDTRGGQQGNDGYYDESYVIIRPPCIDPSRIPRVPG